MRSRCSTHCCLCGADGQNVHCCLCGADGQNVQCVQDAQHTAVFVGRMDRMFNTLLSLWSGWTECSTHYCLCGADGQNVQCVQDAQHTAVFVGRMDRMFNAFNSQMLPSWAPMHHGLSDSSQHVPFLVECNEWLLKVASLGSRKLPCISGWRITSCEQQFKLEDNGTGYSEARRKSSFIQGIFE